MDQWKLGVDGYVMQYMVAGPRISEYVSGQKSSDQLSLEAKLRREIATPKEEKLEIGIEMGMPADNGCQWTAYVTYGNYFIDVSSFYSTLKRIDLEAATVLCVSKDMDVKVRVWTYMAVGVYLNGSLLDEQKRPVYKPIQYLDVILPLKKGNNLLYFKCENLGVRDTRNMLAVQVQECREEIIVSLPDERFQGKVYEEAEFLSGIYLRGEKIIFPQNVPENLFYCMLKEDHDYEVMREPLSWQYPGKVSEIEIQENVARVVVEIRGRGYQLSRTLEFVVHRNPEYKGQDLSYEENFKGVIGRIADVGSLNRGGKYGFAIFNVLARKYLGRECEKDRERILGDLSLIRSRVDCSDFLVCGLLRYMHLYEIDQDLAGVVRETLLDYRYWMDMDGTDAMCFWSENHALMFYAAAMDAGTFYPDDYFHRAKMTGHELSVYGQSRVLEWLEDVEKNGFEEFLSTVYMCVTFAALLNLVDFAKPEIAGRAKSVADRLVEELCLHTFKGCVYAPMGRVYREVIYPFRQGAQSIIHLVNPEVPEAFGEGWLAFLTGSSYYFPDGLGRLMEADYVGSYTSGNARIKLEKNRDYCLTSVECPRQESFQRWLNVRGEDANPSSHAYTRSLNEAFHGTTCFQPGIYGYQQHLWYAALDADSLIFVNHPGTPAENSGMRPGYWYGNGIMPALKQDSGILGIIYDIPDMHPVRFTHVYCPLCKFDEYVAEVYWIFLKKGDGYIALWSSGRMEPYNDMIFDCEFRVYERSMAYLCICGRKKDFNDLSAFMEYARDFGPVYDREKKKITAGKGFELTYCPCEDKTQFVD